jgi:hypothetical protein
LLNFSASERGKIINKDSINQNLNPIETHIHPKKSLNSDGTAPVLLFLIVHGSLSEKLVLYSTSPPDERKSHVKSILIFKERVNWR